MYRLVPCCITDLGEYNHLLLCNCLQEHEQSYPWAAQQLQRDGCAATLWQAVG